MTKLFALIIAFFQGLFGLGGTPVTPTPTPTPAPPAVVEEVQVLEVGDYLTDLKVDAAVEASAQLIQTNGNKFTVEFVITGTPGTTVCLIAEDTSTSDDIPSSGELRVVIRTASLQFEVIAL